MYQRGKYIYGCQMIDKDLSNDIKSLTSTSFSFILSIQEIEWPIARGIHPDEKLDIQLLAHNR